MTIPKVRVQERVKSALRGIGNLSRYPSPFVRSLVPRPASLLSTLCSSWRAAPPALQKELRERRDRSNAGYYKTKDDA